MNIFRVIILTIAFSCVAPVGVRTEEAPARYSLTTRDIGKEKRFELVLRSRDDRPICLEVRRWPNRVGHVHYGNHWVILHTSKGIYRALDENFGRCIGPECIMHIAPRKTLTGFIAYSVFGDEKKVAMLPNRHLEVDVKPVVCALLERLMKETDTEILKH